MKMFFINICLCLFEKNIVYSSLDYINVKSAYGDAIYEISSFTIGDDGDSDLSYIYRSNLNSYGYTDGQAKTDVGLDRYVL